MYGNWSIVLLALVDAPQPCLRLRSQRLADRHPALQTFYECAICIPSRSWQSPSRAELNVLLVAPLRENPCALVCVDSGCVSSNLIVHSLAMRRQDFTVGWICALAHELAASVAMLDKELDSLEEDLADHNNYSYGQIGKHYVVMACLPAGSYGIGAAATVAENMRRSFDIRYALMVGIGGGIPSEKHDIRLGDVVVSQPSNVNGGVIQYDLGKVMSDGSFERKGFLNSPLIILLNAIQRLQARHESSDSTMSKYLDKMLQNNPKMRNTYGRPLAGTDRLYVTECTHENGTPDCQRCGPHLLTQREVRLDSDGNIDSSPMIHYGLIASGNRVIKSATERTRLQTHEDVMCVEMEAAGLMNTFPCLVIRGICDYSDSYKSDGWQRYAASTAAAYARELLDTLVPITPVLSHTQVTEDIKDKCLQWLRPIDSKSLFWEAREKWTISTGDWFIQDKFMTWRKEPSFLWLYGKGAQRSTIIEEIQKQKLGDLVYFYFSFRRVITCGPKEFLSSVLHQLVEARVRKTSQSPLLFELPQAFQVLCDKYTSGQDAQTHELLETIIGVSNEFKSLSIVVDALDECPSYRDRTQIMTYLQHIFTRSTCPVHILITSRRENDIQAVMSNLAVEFRLLAVPLENQYADQDIQEHLRITMQEFPFSQWNNEMKTFTKKSLGSRANGVFRWAECQIRSLEPCLCPADIMEALRHLPEDMDESYARILSKIESTPYANDVFSMLNWLMHSARPLTLQELAETAAISIHRHGEDNYQPSSFEPEKRFMSHVSLRHLLSELVTVSGENTALAVSSKEFDPANAFTRAGQDEHKATRSQRLEPLEHSSVFISHFSVQEYLSCDRVARKWRISTSLAHRFMFESSLMYIQYCAKDATLLSSQSHDYGLLDYASVAWPVHGRKTFEEGVLTDYTIRIFLQLFTTNGTYKFALRSGFTENSSCKNVYQYTPRGNFRQSFSELHLFEQESDYCSPAYFFALHDMVDAFQLLVRSDYLQFLEINRKYREESALHIAIKYGRRKILDMLFECGADVLERGPRSQSLLHFAVHTEDKSMMEEFLRRDPSIVFLTDENMDTVLHRAVRYRQTNFLGWLMQNQSHGCLECQNIHGLTPLHLATRMLAWRPEESSKMMQELLKAGANADAVSYSGKTLRAEAFEYGREITGAYVRLVPTQEKQAPTRPVVIDMSIRSRSSASLSTILGNRCFKSCSPGLAMFNHAGVEEPDDRCPSLRNWPNCHRLLCQAFWDRTEATFNIRFDDVYREVNEEYQDTKSRPESHRGVFLDALKEFVKRQLREISSALYRLPLVNVNRVYANEELNYREVTETIDHCLASFRREKSTLIIELFEQLWQSCIAGRARL